MKNTIKTLAALVLLALVCPLTINAQSKKNTNESVLHTMKAATKYMMETVSYNGGFVWNYLPDFSRSWGEMEAKRTMAWIQTPGTPAVGHLLIDAYHATGDEYYYESACRVARALIWGQLPCGGWNYMFDFAGENSLKEWYSTIGRQGWRLEEFQHYYGNATFDDSTTSDVAKFLLRIYVEKNDPTFRPALDKAIAFILESQYPVGGWPQRYPLKYDHPFQGRADYSSFVTLNDDVIPDNIEFLIQCYQVLGLQNIKEPIMRAMNLMIILQQGKPYAGWSDQYTVDDLKPAHARSYEPRSVNTGTTVRCANLMMDYYLLTGETKFLARIPDAIEFLESQKLPASEVTRFGREAREGSTMLVPRFVDPDTGKPWYVHRKGSNVVNGTYYTDQDISGTIAHYSSAQFINPDDLRKRYQEVLNTPKSELCKESPLLSTGQVPLDKYYTPVRSRYGNPDADVKELISTLTKEGYWLSPLSQVSNPYKPCPDLPASDTKDYLSTMVGDEYDTSPYKSETPVMGISTGVYIANMMKFITYLDSKH